MYVCDCSGYISWIVLSVEVRFFTSLHSSPSTSRRCAVLIYICPPAIVVRIYKLWSYCFGYCFITWWQLCNGGLKYWVTIWNKQRSFESNLQGYRTLALNPYLVFSVNAVSFSPLRWTFDIDLIIAFLFRGYKIAHKYTCHVHIAGRE